MTEREIAEPNIILRCEVGSGAHGIAMAGTDDRDEMAVCIEPPEYVIGLQRFEQWIYRTAEERHGHDPQADQRYRGRTPRSTADDLDLTVYSLRKWARLAANGNPTVLILLFGKPLYAHPLGELLQRNAHMFASRLAGRRFLGYLQAQRERLLGQRGQMRVTRTDLVNQHGFDVKYASHAVRLGIQGVEYLQTGKLTLPMADPGREICRSIRRGEWELDEVVEEIKSNEARVLDLLDRSPLPEGPIRPMIDRFLNEAYVAWWGKYAK